MGRRAARPLGRDIFHTRNNWHSDVWLGQMQTSFDILQLRMMDWILANTGHSIWNEKGKRIRVFFSVLLPEFNYTYIRIISFLGLISITAIALVLLLSPVLFNLNLLPREKWRTRRKQFLSLSKICRPEALLSWLTSSLSLFLVSPILATKNENVSYGAPSPAVMKGHHSPFRAPRRLPV